MDEHEALIDDLRGLLRSSEFYRWAGVELVDASPGDVEIAFEAGPEHLNLQGLVHGGILATLADTAMGLAVRTVLRAGPASRDRAARDRVPLPGTTRAGSSPRDAR